MSGSSARIFSVKDRGFIREGYWADLVLVDLNKPQTVAIAINDSDTVLPTPACSHPSRGGE